MSDFLLGFFIDDFAGFEFYLSFNRMFGGKVGLGEVRCGLAGLEFFSGSFKWDFADYLISLISPASSSRL